jgi:MoxR-like ATPase
MEGTYRLPEAQLDRFLMRLSVGYPNLESEVLVIMSDCAGVGPDELSPVVDIATLQKAVDEVRTAHIDPAVVEYAARLTAATRTHVALRYGASPRGSIALVRAGQAVAATYGRDYVTPDDIKEVAKPVLEHRLILTSEAELNQRSTSDIVDEVLAAIPAPAVGSRV